MVLALHGGRAASKQKISRATGGVVDGILHIGANALYPRIRNTARKRRIVLLWPNAQVDDDLVVAHLVFPPPCPRRGGHVNHVSYLIAYYAGYLCRHHPTWTTPHQCPCHYNCSHLVEQPLEYRRRIRAAISLLTATAAVSSITWFAYAPTLSLSGGHPDAPLHVASS